MTAQSLDVLRGTFDLLVLKSLSAGPLHGAAIAQWIERATIETLVVEDGTIYPALQRLERRRVIKSEEGISENNRRARFYSLTPAGRSVLRADLVKWRELVSVLYQAVEDSETPVPEVLA